MKIDKQTVRDRKEGNVKVRKRSTEFNLRHRDFDNNNKINSKKHRLHSIGAHNQFSAFPFSQNEMKRSDKMELT